MVMIEKSLVIIIFMYSSSFALLGMQYTIADSFGLNLVGANGADISSETLDFIKLVELNARTEAMFGENVNKTQMGLEPIIFAAGLVVEIFTLLTGTYIFLILFHVLGIPPIWIGGFVILYFFLLMRTIVAYLRGI